MKLVAEERTGGLYKLKLRVGGSCIAEVPETIKYNLVTLLSAIHVVEGHKGRLALDWLLHPIGASCQAQPMINKGT